jgi:hypothetical protein
LDWFLRARESKLNIVLLESVSLYYRRHIGSLSHASDRAHDAVVRMLKQSLDRRRTCVSDAAVSLVPHRRES